MHELYFCHFLYLTFPYGPSTSVLRDIKQQRIKTNFTKGLIKPQITQIERMGIRWRVTAKRLYGKKYAYLSP